jgi:SH3-like domain-containing protein
MIRLFQLGSRHKLRSVAVALLLMADVCGAIGPGRSAGGGQWRPPHDRAAAAAFRQPEVRQCECAPRTRQEYDLAFTFVRAGLPVEIIQEFDNWRKIRDSEGAEGWVFHSLLSGERTVLVAPWEAGAQQHSAYQKASGSAAVVAYLQPRVVANVEQCTGAWCLVSGDTFQGWLEQDKLWGVYPQEQFED